jgi:hypothetical protein
MGIGMFGTVLLILLLILCFRSRGAIFPALVALLLGITIAGSPGPLANTSVSAVNALRSGIVALSQSLFGGGA